MLIARRGMTLDGQAVEPGQVLDGIWPGLRERTRRALLGNNWVDEVVSTGVPSTGLPSTGLPSTEPAAPPPKKRGRPRKQK